MSALDESLSVDSWTPPVQTFKVGDRVRIRLSGECPRMGTWSEQRETHWYGHHSEHDGHIGKVNSVHVDDYGHPYFVECEAGRHADDDFGGFYEAVELEPLP